MKTIGTFFGVELIEVDWLPENNYGFLDKKQIEWCESFSKLLRLVLQPPIITKQGE